MKFQFDQSFEILEERLSKVQKHAPISLVDYDLVNPYREKRKQAVKRVLEENKNISDLYLWEDDYLDLSFFYTKTYEMVESEKFITLGMAYYMLEHIQQKSDLRKLAVGLDLDQVHMPAFKPLSYELDDIKAILYIIQHRNDDLGENKRILLNKYSLQKKVPEVPSRARFHALLHLVGHQNEAIDYFRIKRSEWTKAFTDALASFDSKVESSYFQTSYTGFYQDELPIRRDYVMFRDFLEPDFSYKTREERREQALTIHKLYKKVPEAMSMTKKRSEFSSSLVCDIKHVDEETEAYKMMDAFEIEDGGLLVYGLLNILDTRDDILFDYGCNIALLLKASEDFVWNHTTLNTRLVQSEKKTYFKKEYIDQNDHHASLPDYIYATSQYVLPEYITSVKAKVRLNAKDQGFLDGFMTAQRRLQYQEKDDNHLEEEVIGLEEENKKLRKDAELLKGERYHYSSMYHDYQEKYQHAKQDYDQLLQETAKLREIIFHASDTDLPEEKVNIAFPYHVKEKILVYGGHKSWNKNIKQLFEGDIEFMLKGQRPPHDYLESFDVIFLQTDSIGHDDYYYLIDIVRRYHLNFQYFTMRGVKACAKELVEYEER